MRAKDTINPKKLDATIRGQFTADQLEYMEKARVSAERFSRVAALGKAWLDSVTSKANTRR